MKILKILFFILPGLLFGEHSANCTVYFSPKDRLADRLIELIDKEEKSIKIAIYSMTHLGIAKALTRAKERGVAIEVLIDPFAMKTRSSVHQLVKAHIPLFVWDQAIHLGKRKNKNKALMHDKFCIFGDKIVWTGSFNFTNDAHLKHQENAVTMESPSIAGQYLSQFSHMKLYESRPYQEYLSLYQKNLKSRDLGSAKAPSVRRL